MKAMTHTQGGRGHKAPYETKMIRVPVPLATQVALIVSQYHEFVANGGDALNPPAFNNNDKVVDNFKAENQEPLEQLNAAMARIDELQASKAVNNFEDAVQPQGQTLEPLVDAALEIYEIGKDNGYLFSMLNKIAMQSGLRLYKSRPEKGKLYNELYFITPYDKTSLKLVEGSSIGVIVAFLKQQYVKQQPGAKQ